MEPRYEPKFKANHLLIALIFLGVGFVAGMWVAEQLYETHMDDYDAVVLLLLGRAIPDQRSLEALFEPEGSLGIRELRKRLETQASEFAWMRVVEIPDNHEEAPTFGELLIEHLREAEQTQKKQATQPLPKNTGKKAARPSHVL